MAEPKATAPEALLDAATAAFSEKGHRSATLEDIAARAGISKPTVCPVAHEPVSPTASLVAGDR